MSVRFFFVLRTKAPPGPASRSPISLGGGEGLLSVKELRFLFFCSLKSSLHFSLERGESHKEAERESPTPTPDKETSLFLLFSRFSLNISPPHLVLASDVPHGERYVLVLDGFDVEACFFFEFWRRGSGSEE